MTKDFCLSSTGELKCTGEVLRTPHSVSITALFIHTLCSSNLWHLHHAAENKCPLWKGNDNALETGAMVIFQTYYSLKM